jgi:glycosyltransferase involved in cell wall biosynthesis
MRQQTKLETELLMSKFYVNNINDNSGPNIFATRLKDALVDQGHTFIDTRSNDSFNNISIITGTYFPQANNILRLDGLYFDKHNPNCDSLNKPIFKCYEMFDKVVFQSEFSKKVYETFTGIVKDNVVIHNGVPSSFNPWVKPYLPEPKAKEYEKVCITSASWRRHKRLEELVEAFKSPKLSHACLLVLGGQDYNIDCEIPENVFMLKKYPHRDLPSIYACADAMLFISWLDSCPNTVVEALACGIPVMCSHNGGTPELINGNGVVLQLEEDYNYGEKVSLYVPSKVDNSVVVEGVLKVLEMPRGFERPDLDIGQVASKYEELFQ